VDANLHSTEFVAPGQPRPQLSRLSDTVNHTITYFPYR